MKIALIGADGQLGSDLARTLREESLTPLFYPDFDITRPGRARDVLREIGPDLVVNTAAFHRVDDCEDLVEEAFRLNAFAVRDLAMICRDLGAALAHFSTDYVFDGSSPRPYVEEDAPRPLSVYGASKLAGEHFVRAICERHYLVRTCGLFGLAGCIGKGRNFVEAMLTLAESGRPLRVVNDQWVTPTSTAELAERLTELFQIGRYGLYHLTNEGRCTWFTFAAALFELCGRSAAIEPIDTAAFGAKAKRPAFSVLENKRAKELGLADFSPWRVALKDYLGKRGLLADARL